MHLNVCKSCGGETVRQGNYYVCKFCGNKWMIDAAEDVHVVDRANAWAALRDCDFERSAELFENIIYKDPKGHEAYWGRALANAGIMYVTDYHENKKVPTCNSISEASFLESADVRKAISLAPVDIANTYRSQATQIENIRVEWVKKASREPAYDVFICFKDSDRENGIERTPDSYDAQELYSLLTDEGYKVFFSRVSLRGKVSEHYEPYIYNALRTAKVMIVFGEKPEYFNAVWVKNEWIRFRAMIERGEKDPKSLVVVYKNMSPSDLPMGLKNRQCLCESELTFLEDLKRHINKIIHPERDRGAAAYAPAYDVAPAQKKKKKVGGVIAAVAVAMALCIGLAFAIPRLGSIITQTEETFDVSVEIGGNINRPIYTIAPDGELTVEKLPPSDDKNNNGIPDDEEGFLEDDGIPDYEFPNYNLGGNGGFEVIEPDVDIDGDGVIDNPSDGGATDDELVADGLRFTYGAEAGAYEVSMIYQRRTEYVIPSEFRGEPVTGIGYGAFMGCDTLISVVIPDSVTYIADNAFQDCTMLQEIILPDSVAFIGDEAFSGCTALEKVQVGPRFLELGTDVFYRCTSLKEIVVPDDNPIFSSDNGILYSRDGNCLIRYPSGRTDASFEIPRGVDSIGVAAFEGCIYLENVIIPEGVNGIGQGAFEDCSSLTTVSIPTSMVAIDFNAFKNCPINTVHFIGNEAQWNLISIAAGNDSLKNAERSKATCEECIPGEIQIENYVPATCAERGGYDAVVYCSECDGVISSIYVELEEKPHVPGPYWLEPHTDSSWTARGDIWYTVGCSVCGNDISRRIISSGFVSHYLNGDGVCETCGVTQSEGLDLQLNAAGNGYIVMGVGEWSGTDLIIPRYFEGFPVLEIRENAFKGNSEINKVWIGDNVETIGEDAFNGCNALTDVTLGANLKLIGERAFAGTALSSIVINDGVETIGKEAFAYCEMLSDVIAGINVRSIGDYAFKDCRELKSFAYSSSTSMLESIGVDVFYNCYSLKELIVPDNVTSLGDGFAQNSGIATVYLGKKITTVPMLAFSGCHYLTSVNYAGDVTHIANGAFYNCTALDYAPLKDSVTNIAHNAFDGCILLSVVNLPRSIQEIGAYAFSNCSNLKLVTYADGEDALNGVFIDEGNDYLVNAFKLYGDIAY